MFGALKHFDIPDLAAALEPQPLLVVNPTDQMLNPLSDDQARQAFNFTRYAYSTSGATDNFQLLSGVPESDLFKEVQAWVTKAL